MTKRYFFLLTLTPLVADQLLKRSSALRPYRPQFFLENFEWTLWPRLLSLVFVRKGGM